MTTADTGAWKSSPSRRPPSMFQGTTSVLYPGMGSLVKQSVHPPGGSPGPEAATLVLGRTVCFRPALLTMADTPRMEDT